MEIIAKTLQGFEGILAGEIEALGGKNITPLKRAVKYEGDLELLYKSNYLLRTALRVITPFREEIVKNELQLYKKVYDYPWEELFSVKDSFSINPIVNSEIFRHSQYAGLKTKDAIVDRFRDKFGRRPNVNPVNALIQLDLHIREDKLTLSLDSSGHSLHMRGYRMYPVEAPLNEVLAAGIVMLSGWNGTDTFVDPMCGSGTILIEAARIAGNIPPQRKDASFCFQNWTNYDAKLWEKIITEADANIKPIECEILGFDKSLQCVKASETNILEAGLENKIKVSRKDFFLQTDLPKCLIITNPPYDERLKLEDDMLFYKQIGDLMKKQLTGSAVWIFSGNMEALKHVGLKPSKRISLMNGPIEAGFYKFEVYEGSKR
ncbi:MAG: class I SAM-dependent RNA methyltransferase [Saprospiraceae bacterium]|nr:class I SAM-dependent RNA methyltransferase [Saprospiraceae bacterium]